ncbi:recombinase family protein [Halospina sp. K52047b]|uniref:recombinase family protein n=1 Tax=Halospina sp. K52047b TaxID=2614160 RepID=UPI00124A826E|nr:recombinase family protein [Halospina sp. K52047b]KAA8976140.1 recombinase family protein [Halospina sp. K52047b]
MLIGYARVSTQDQTAEFQVDALEKAGCEQVFQEKVTGKSKERPELSQCLRTLRKGDVLVVWKLDRLARSLKDLVEIVQDLNDREIGFKSLTEAIDTTSSGGRLVFHIFGALAEFEHDLIRERTKAGLEAARARGRKGGRKPAMSDADAKKAAAMLSDPKITKREVAEHFKVSRTTLNASLARVS